MKTTSLDIAVGIVLAQIFTEGGTCVLKTIMRLSECDMTLNQSTSFGFYITLILLGVSFPAIAYYTIRD